MHIAFRPLVYGIPQLGGPAVRDRTRELCLEQREQIVGKVEFEYLVVDAGQCVGIAPQAAPVFGTAAFVRVDGEAVRVRTGNDHGFTSVPGEGRGLHYIVLAVPGCHGRHRHAGFAEFQEGAGLAQGLPVGESLVADVPGFRGSGLGFDGVVAVEHTAGIRVYDVNIGRTVVHGAQYISGQFHHVFAAA